MPIIDVNNLSFSYSAQPLLSSISLTVGDGERAVIVGPNGSGKTTLLRILSGEITPDRGKVSVTGLSDLSALRVPSVLNAHGTVQDYLNEALAEVYGLLSRFDEVTAKIADNPSSAALGDEYDALLAQLNAVDAWSIDARIDETLAKLGLPQLATEPRDRNVLTLSPGQAGRLELAGLVISRPSVLVLDEPTNHLDDEMVAYLIDQVREWIGPVLIASHDRAFIDAVTTVIYDLDTAAWQALLTADGGGSLPGVYRCSGSYTDYLAAKNHAQSEHKKIHAAQQSTKRDVKRHRRDSEDIARGGVRLATAQGVAKKFFSDRAAATSVRRTSNDDQRLEDLAKHEVRKPRSYNLNLDLPQVKPGAGLAVAARSAAADGRLSATTFDLSAGDHLLLTGPNGAGKSTLLRWIATGQPPSQDQARSTGTISINARLAYVPQHLPTSSDPNITPELWSNGIGDLGTGVLHPSMWNTPIPQLSAGNQRRAQIAVAIARAPEILVIDEPTNYLDLATIEELETALADWSGTLIIASHDRWLIDHWQGERLELRSAGTSSPAH